MCGIAGLWFAGGDPNIGRYTKEMCDTLQHRGPDGGGIWVAQKGEVSLGHRRLSIIDTTPAGHQPMSSQCGRFTITYNGEIYNADELRRELKALGYRFRGHSDTEVLVNAIAKWGLSKACLKLSGMFAFAVWDESRQELSLARDRAGIKPLFVSSDASLLSFASELRALTILPKFDRSIDEHAALSLLQNNHVQSPRTIFRQVKSVAPGSVVTFTSPSDSSTHTYWECGQSIISRSDNRRAERSVDVTIDELERLLDEAVRRQMVSDVPIGAFLSGGIDSSIVAALMQKHSSGRVKTFSIGFDEPGLDEAPFAKAVAAHLGTEHRELYFDEKTLVAAAQDITKIFDQPISDVSSIPMLLLSRMASEDVTVCLSGDGGDELFFGYKRFRDALKVRRALSFAPKPLLGASAATASLLSSERIRDHGFLRPGFAKRSAWHAARLLNYGARDLNDVYLHFITAPLRQQLMESSLTNENDLWNSNKSAIADFPELLMLHDFTGYLPDEVLTKLDRTTMASSLEGRVPFLDERVVEFAWDLPMSMKLKDGIGKWCLRQVLSRHVPRTLIDRPKAGFSPPMGRWLRGPLREWAESLTGDAAIKSFGLLNVEFTRAIWRAHCDEKIDASSQLWSILMLQSWLVENNFS